MKKIFSFSFRKSAKDTPSQGTNDASPAPGSTAMSREKSMGAREKSGKKLAGAGGAQGPPIESMSLEQLREQAKTLRLQAEQLEKENEDLQTQLPKVEGLLQDEQKLEDEIRTLNQQLEAAQQRLRAAQTERRMFEEGVNNQGGNTTLEAIGKRIVEIEKVESEERIDYEAMYKAIQDQDRMIAALAQQVTSHRMLRKPTVEPPAPFKVQYYPPEYQEWGKFLPQLRDDYKTGRYLQPRPPKKTQEERAAERTAAEKAKAAEQAAAAAAAAAAAGDKKGKGGASSGSDVRWQGAYPDAGANRSGGAQSSAGGGKKASKWEVKTYGMGQRGGGEVGSRERSTEDKKDTNASTMDESSGASASGVKNLFSRFESGEIQAETERKNDQRSAGKEFDRGGFSGSRQNTNKSDFEEDATGGKIERVESEGARELAKIQSAGSSARNLSAKFETGEIARQGSHEQEFANKEFDKTGMSNKVSKKFLL